MPPTPHSIGVPLPHNSRHDNRPILTRMTDSKQFATFFLNGLFFGIEVLKVQEVIRYQEMTRLD